MIHLRRSLFLNFNCHITEHPFLSSNIPSSKAYGVFISQLIRCTRDCSSYKYFILRATRTFQQATQAVIPLWALLHSGCFMADTFILFSNIKSPSHEWHSNSRTVRSTVTSLPIIIFTNFIILISSFTFQNQECFSLSIYNGCGVPVGNDYPSGHPVPSIFGLANAPWDQFSQLAVSFIYF